VLGLQATPLSSPPPTIVRPSQVPTYTAMTESTAGVVPHIEAVRVLPVPVTENHRPRRELCAPELGVFMVTIGFDSGRAPV